MRTRSWLVVAPFSLVCGCGAVSSIPDAAVLPSSYCADATPAQRAQIVAQLPHPLAVLPVHAQNTGKNPVPGELVGVRVVVPAPAGWTAPWLERVLQCHVADHPDGAAGPFIGTPSPAEVHVRESGGTLHIDAEAATPAQAKQLLERSLRWAHSIHSP